MKRLSCALVSVFLVVSGCAGGEPVEEPVPSPSEAAVSSESPSPEVEVDPESGKWICEDLRLRDSYVQADSLEPHEEAQIIILEMDANTKALAEDAEPALREIALDNMSDRDVAVALMIEWCQENTEAINPSSPW